MRGSRQGRPIPPFFTCYHATMICNIANTALLRRRHFGPRTVLSLPLAAIISPLSLTPASVVFGVPSSNVLRRLCHIERSNDLNIFYVLVLLMT